MNQRRINVCDSNDSNLQRIKNANAQLKSKKLRTRRNIPSRCNAWKILKTIIFIICLVFFFYQSMSFLITEFYAYPTTTRFTVIKPEKFKMPCITFCNNNPIRRSKFCSEYPYLCVQPENLTEFCLEYPHMCSRNISNLVIPRMPPFSNETKELFENLNLSKKTWSTWTWDIPTDLDWSSRESEMTVSLVKGRWMMGHSTCYSANLRFSNKLPARTWPIIFPPEDLDKSIVEGFRMIVDEDELFFPSDIPQVSLVIHSPFVPGFPLAEGMLLKIGFSYLIAVKLEEEHLSKYPYDTDCVDYDALWRRNNKTGPRSQEVCMQWCLWNNYTRCREFHPRALMVQYSENMCELNSQNQLEPNECMKNCKANCIKLKYTYKVTERPGLGNNEREIVVAFSVENPQVAVRSHIPLYDAGDLFSHIGGLMGCWLGFSVATFAGILESAFTELKHLTSRFRRYVR